MCCRLLGKAVGRIGILILRLLDQSNAIEQQVPPTLLTWLFFPRFYIYLTNLLSFVACSPGKAFLSKLNNSKRSHLPIDNKDLSSLLAPSCSRKTHVAFVIDLRIYSWSMGSASFLYKD
ncbi:hypothetical protein NE237_007672 [Protea cynaroides]|uniref:Uncharacterized protein n=1 Tax=Protea cynaroides TaxID=273540 RepID=A0A9Q0KPP4_9MAGN|nr:hypothetical protein NE237_007672 [Protea cynaroides]